MTHEKKLCPAIWFSGFFGLGAVMHLARSILRFPLVVNNYEVPIVLSVTLAVVLGAISLALLYVGCRKPCCKKEEKEGSCG